LHTHTHSNVVANHDRLREELRLNRHIIEGLTGQPAVHFCYPLGIWEKRAWSDLAAEGIVSAVTTRHGPNFPETPPLCLRRYLNGESTTDTEFELMLSGARWMLQLTRFSRNRFEPSEKLVPYSVQPDLF
jgi:hypothetical protein